MIYNLLYLPFYKKIVSYFIIFNLTFIITLNLLNNSSLADESTAVFFLVIAITILDIFLQPQGTVKIGQQTILYVVLSLEMVLQPSARVTTG